jgi:hypothetical protein
MGDWVITPQARDHLVGLTIESIEEIFPHGMTIRFRDDTALCIVAMPFKGGVLDVQVIEGLDKPFAVSGGGVPKP